MSEALESLIASMRAHQLDYWLQPVADEFQGEYPPACSQRLAYLTGFTGSAGLGVFRAAPGKHVVLVDGRYTLQAAAEVEGARIECLNSGEIGLAQWLEQQPMPATLGFDPWLTTQQQLTQWKAATEHLAVTFKAITPNLVDAGWRDRPRHPQGAVRIHPHALAGESYEEKREKLVAAMQKRRADALVIAEPDAVNWLLNIRGADVPFNPLLLCYFILNVDGHGRLFTFERSFDKSVDEYLANHRIQHHNIASIFESGTPIFAAKTKVLADPASAAHGWWLRAQDQGWEIRAGDDPTAVLKASKNSAELAAIKDAHQRDGLALVRFFHWLDERASHGDLPDELGVVDRLERFRAHDAEYREPSFATIAGAGSNAAIVHYRASLKTSRRLKAGELLLLDSGGQYAGGTTDVTRTVWLPSTKEKPTDLIKEHYTRVLKGHIALATAVFPEGTTGGQLDALARQYLWQVGLDYDHGTGHGVGAGLCVHEGPQRISKRGSAVPLVPGMILSNEPGYYRQGSYGIRIENLVAVRAVGTTEHGKSLLGFETLTLAPIDTRLIAVSLLTTTERNWLNAYHRQVHNAHVEALDAQQRNWLEQATRAI